MTSAAILIKQKARPGWLRPGLGDESGADLDDFFTLVMPAIRAGAVALVATLPALRAVVQLRCLEFAIAGPALSHAALG